jgi:hypothetical protein
MRYVTAAAIAFIVCASPALAQVTTPFETYTYGTGSASGPPFASSLYIPAVPNSSSFSMQHIPASVLGLMNLQTGSGAGLSLTGPVETFVCTSTCTVTPPVPVAGYQFCVLNDDNVSTVITLGALGSGAFYENAARTAYGTAGSGTLTSGGAVADIACIIGRDSTHYLTIRTGGTWTAS